MIDLNAVDYSPLDVPEVLLRLFHPRPELDLAGVQTEARDLLIPVADNAVVGARFHPAAAGGAHHPLLPRQRRDRGRL